MARRSIGRQPSVNEKVLNCFYSLASEKEQERVEAAKILVEELDSVDDLDDKVSYVCDRLVNGLTSSRAAARRGFALALTIFLQQRSKKFVYSGDYALAHSIASKLEKKLDNIRSAKGSEGWKEIRENVLGVLFGIAAIEKTRLVKSHRVLAILHRIVSHKKYSTALTDAVLEVAFDCLSHIDTETFRKKGSLCRKAIVKWIESRGLENPDALALALWCRHHYQLNDLESECPLWSEKRDPVKLSIETENSTISSSMDVSMQSIFLTGSCIPKGHIPYVWSVWCDLLVNTSHSEFRKWWKHFVTDNLISEKKSTERVLLGLRLTCLVAEHNGLKKDMIEEIIDQKFLSTLTQYWQDMKATVIREEALQLEERLVVILDKVADESFSKKIIEWLLLFVSEMVFWGILSWLNDDIDYNLVRLFCILLSELCDRNQVKQVFSSLLKTVLETEKFSSSSMEKAKDSMMGAIGRLVTNEGTYIYLIDLANVAKRTYPSLSKGKKISMVYDFAVQHVVKDMNKEGKKEDSTMPYFSIMCALTILICLGTKEEDMEQWYDLGGFHMLNKLSGLIEKRENEPNINEETKEPSYFVKFLVACLILESRGIRQIVNHLFKKTVKSSKRNFLPFLLAYLPGSNVAKDLQEKVMGSAMDMNDKVDNTLELDSTEEGSSEDGMSHDSDSISDSEENDSFDEESLEEKEQDALEESFSNGELIEAELDKDLDEEDESVLEEYDKRISLLMKELHGKTHQNTYAKQSHFALRILDLVQFVLEQQTDDGYKLHLASCMLISTMETTDSDLASRVDKIFRKVLLREVSSPNVFLKVHVLQLDLLRECLNRYSRENQLLEETTFRMGIFVLTYLFKCFYRQYMKGDDVSREEKELSLTQQYYRSVCELMNIFLFDSMGIVLRNGSIKGSFSLKKVSFLQDTLWKRFPLLTCFALKRLCSIYRKYETSIQREKCLEALVITLKQVIAYENLISSKEEVIIAEDRHWLESLYSFLKSTVATLRRKEYSILLVGCLRLIKLLLKSGYAVDNELLEMLNRKLEFEKKLPHRVHESYQLIKSRCKVSSREDKRKREKETDCVGEERSMKKPQRILLENRS
eukprot:jgi/Galph1/4701/GphlegSOOS_G3336.1